ncbi:MULTISPECIES: DUF1707 domain-containing protein [unclassified Nocardioides]|uniref:DUF1707 SHOCT-like domain-containing protein n=1 Tax=unclassified Nocardioides TaxID=2615069 RepID=UPI0000571329|nr:MULTISPECIES: DUF1707 domain-containing protein [unclassified Nocardioides]ABL84106.1 protein of unknown function DUF1707 [Nocardioides sp. JS614]
MTDEHLRIGDAEREQAAAALGEHYAQGRLTSEEYAERLDRIWAARTRADLGPIFRDLPGRYGPAGQIPGAMGQTVGRTRGRASAGPARRPAYRCGGMALSRHGLPTPIIVVLAVLLVLTVLTHLPLILAGLLVAWFVMSRHRRFARARQWSR